MSANRTKRRPPITVRATLTARSGSRSDSLLGQILLYGLLISLTVIYIFPFLVQVATSFKTDAEAASDPISLVPNIWTTQAYEHLFLRSDFPVWFMNSAIVTVLVTLGRVFFVSLAGYALRSEERRVGKEGRCRRLTAEERQKTRETRRS